MTNQAKIEIRTRDVNGIPYIPTQGDAQHLFIIHIDSTGKKTILRGGPGTNMLTGDLKLVNSPYERQYEHLFPGDFIDNAPSRVIATGNTLAWK